MGPTPRHQPLPPFFRISPDLRLLKAGGLNFGADIDNYYSQSHCCDSIAHSDAIANPPPSSPSLNSLLSSSSLPARGLDKQLQQIYHDIASNPNLVIHKDLFTYTRSQLHKGIDQVFGDPKPTDRDFNLVQQLKANADRFSGYKSAWQTAHMRNAEPAQLAAINSRYNVAWMRTEYTHTVRSARAAYNWQGIKDDQDIYPYLEYMPSTAAEPRNEHKRLYGVIKPVDDPFWDTWMPPADWGCRCSVKQVRSDARAKEPPADIKLPPATMRNNPGKSGQIFTDEHPMIKKVGQRNKEAVNSVYEALQRKAIRQEATEVMKSKFLGQTFSFKLPDGEITTIPLSTNNIKEIINQPVNNLNVKNELSKYLSGLVDSSALMKPPVASSSKKFKRFYYFKIKGYDYMFNVGQKNNGEYVLYSLTDIKKPV